MIVVSDTSPLTALLTIGEAALLQRQFGQIIIPTEVNIELARSHSLLPAWITTQSPKDPVEIQRLMQFVDKGEAEAIALAKEIHADRLLIDERKGRALAVREGVPVIGLLGVVLLARRQKMIPSARALLDRLETEAGMYLAAAVKNQALQTVGE